MSSSSNDDIKILKDPYLFELFFKKYYTSFCVLAYKFLNNKEIAEEIVQDVFVKIWEKRNKIEVKGSLIAYFNLAIKNTCLNYFKHKRIELQYIQQYKEMPVEFQEEHELFLIEKIKKAIEALPEQRRKIFLMSREQDLKYHEIAKKMNISIKTVETQMGLALKQLRNCLKDYLNSIQE